MSVKNWFMRGWKISEEITELEKIKDELEAEITEIKKRLGGNIGMELLKLLNELEAYDEELSIQIYQLTVTKRDIYKVISCVDDSTLRLLLIKRYVEFKTFEKIAEELYYNNSYIISRLHPRALSAAEKVLHILFPDVLVK